MRQHRVITNAVRVRKFDFFQLRQSESFWSSDSEQNRGSGSVTPLWEEKQFHFLLLDTLICGFLFDTLTDIYIFLSSVEVRSQVDEPE